MEHIPKEYPEKANFVHFIPPEQLLPSENRNEIEVNKEWSRRGGLRRRGNKFGFNRAIVG